MNETCLLSFIINLDIVVYFNHRLSSEVHLDYICTTRWETVNFSKDLHSWLTFGGGRTIGSVDPCRAGAKVTEVPEETREMWRWG
jgi:hypothetical protein